MHHWPCCMSCSCISFQLCVAADTTCNLRIPYTTYNLPMYDFLKSHHSCDAYVDVQNELKSTFFTVFEHQQKEACSLFAAQYWQYWLCSCLCLHHLRAQYLVRSVTQLWVQTGVMNLCCVWLQFVTYRKVCCLQLLYGFNSLSLGYNLWTRWA